MLTKLDIYLFLLGTEFLINVTRRIPLEQELLTLSNNLGLPPLFCGVWLAQTLVLCVELYVSLFVILFSFWQLHCLSFIDVRLLVTHYIVCPSSMYDFSLPIILSVLHRCTTSCYSFVSSYLSDLKKSLKIQIGVMRIRK